MAAIPINPSSVANAGIYPVPLNATPMNICKAPQEGVKCVPMQFKFDVKTSWSVNLFAGSPTPLSQICGLFIDTTNSDRDVNIFFPDTGYQVRVEQGGGRMIPVLTGTSTPIFYVILDSSDILTDDVVNVIAMNQFIPEFSSGEIQKVLSYGYGPMFNLQPSFTAGTSFIKQPNFVQFPATIITATQWYITAINVSAGNIAGAAANQLMQFILIDGTSPDPVIDVFVQIDNVQRAYQIFNLSGLNVLSSGTGNLTATLSFTGGGLTSGNFAINIFGGILVV